MKLIIFIPCTLKDSRKSFMQSLCLYTLWLFSMPLNDDIVDIEKPDGLCSLTFVADDFSRLLLHPPIFTIRDSRYA